MARHERRGAQEARFVLNGLIATLAHYAALLIFLHALRLPSAGLSNALAALVGITVSFFGSRHFVFRSVAEPLLGQISRFWVLYSSLAAIQGGWLYLWTDVGGLDYRVGFLVGVAIQTLGSYFGGRLWVFSPRS